MKTLFLALTFFIFFFHLGCKKDQVPDCDDYTNSTSVDSLKIKRKVLIIGIDGFRSDAMQVGITPFMHSLSLNNNVYFTPANSAEGDTYSGPNWSSLLTGVHYDKHTVTDNSFEGNTLDRYPPFFSYIEGINKNINTISIVNWTPINDHILSSCTDFAPTESINDAIVFEKAKDLLINSNPVSPDVVFLHFDELDATGHNYGFSPSVQEYANTLNTLDSYVNELFNLIDTKRVDGEDWICFIVSDHGGEGTGHGDSSNPNINKTIFFANHPTLNFKKNYTSNQTDLSASVLDFLGITNSTFDCKTDGISILE
jgi:predicted AlkP superfamily pyrophosphatase or phosphodiesterase